MSAAAELDTRTPDAARVYNYWIGGVKSFEADREFAARVEALYPPGGPGPGELAGRNRAFLERAVSSSIHDLPGPGQVVDLGAGFPAPKPLHEVAQAARDTARVAYVDVDERVVLHGRAATQDVPGVVYARADLSRPGDVMAHPDVLSVINPARPVLAVFGLVLTFASATDARRIIEGWADWLPSGSRVVITVASWTDAVLHEQVRALYAPVPVHSHSKTQVAAMLRGMDLLGEIVTARGWCPEEIEPPGPGRILGVVARKP